MIGDPVRAEDLVQDTFLSALRCQDRLDEGRPVAPWLKTVARRRSIDELRSRDRVALMAEPPEPLGQPVEDPADHVVSQELVEQLRRAIAALSVRERQLLLRQASYGLSLAELAAEEDTSIASVRSVLARARQKLRLSLERGGVFGALPLPRYLATLRDRLYRWGWQLEPTLPAMTGAGARFGEAVAAVITAIALFLSGGGLPGFGGSTLTTGELASADQPVRSHSASGASFGMPPGGDGGGATTARPRPTAPGAIPLAPLPPLFDDPPTFPNDGTTAPDSSEVGDLAASEDGQAILMSAMSAGSTEWTLFRSLDGGQSWARHTDDSIGHMQRHHTFLGDELTVAPSYPADPRVYAVSSQGVVQRSVDGGLSFEPIVGARGGVVLSPNFGTSDNRVYVAGPPPSIYDDGDPVLKPLAPHAPSHQAGEIDLAPEYATTGAILLGTATTRGATTIGVISTCSTTGCTTRAEIPEAGGTVEIHVAKTSPGTVFAWRNGRFFRSTDDGYTFAQVRFPKGFIFVGLTEDADRVLVYGNNYSGAAAPMYSSSDGGATWTAVGEGSSMDENVHTAIALANGRIIASQGGGIYCSVDNGETWAPRCPS